MLFDQIPQGLEKKIIELVKLDKVSSAKVLYGQWQKNVLDKADDYRQHLLNKKK